MNYRNRFGFPLFAIVWLVFLYSCNNTGRVILSAYTLPVLASETVTETTSEDSLLRPYKEFIDSVYRKVIAVTDRHYVKNVPEGNLGNLCSDAILLASKEMAVQKQMPSDMIALLNNGGFRAELPKGEIRIADVFSVMPFENKIVLLQLSGTEMQKLFAGIAAQGGAPISGLRLILDGEGKWISALVNNKPFDVTGSYTLVTSDYLIDGSDNYPVLKKVSVRIETGILIRDAIIDHLKNGGKAEANEGRIIIENK